MNGDETSKPHHGTGHRERLRHRLLEGGPNALLEHELIEYLLCLAVPRRDMKPLAKKLLDEFGGIGALLTADPHALLRIKDMGEASLAAIKLAQAIALRALEAQVKLDHVLSNWQALLDYLHLHMANRLTECVHVLHLDSRNRLIRDERVSEGTIDSSAVHTREIVRRALELGSASLILVHNHPSGDPQPSRADIAITREIIDAAKLMKIAVHDHVIIGNGETRSMKAMGLI